MSVSTSHDRPLSNSYWVVPGRLAAGEYPGAKDPAVAAARLRALLGAGIDHFVDLTESHEGLEPYAALAEGEALHRGTTVVHARHPIADGHVPRTREEMAEILDAIDAALGDARTLYLHCWGGVGRTGTVVGCWLVRHGRTGNAALAQIAEWWQGMEKAYRQPRSPETSQQHAYVRDWAEPPPDGAL